MGGSVNNGNQVGKTFECRQGAHQVHVDLAKTEGGFRDVLWGYLCCVVDLGPLAAQAGLRPGGDVCGETLPNIPGGDKAASHPLARMGGTVEVFENLSQTRLIPTGPPPGGTAHPQLRLPYVVHTPAG